MIAQRYPEAYDGILAAAPALNWASLAGSLYHAQSVLNTVGERPPNCEFEAMTAAAIEACDILDGVKDLAISLPGFCDFDPFSVVGQSVDCGNGTTTISMTAAMVANASWYGIRDQKGEHIYPGYALDAPLVTVANTDCHAIGTCNLQAWSLGFSFYRLFVEKNSSFDPTTITEERLPRYVHASRQEWDSIIGTNDADLTSLKEAGTKLLSWHGMADDLIPYGGSVQYFNRVAELDADIDDYYKLFLAPGVHHCAGGPGATPIDPLQQLVLWVENGTAPEFMPAVGTQLINGTVLARNLCRYPSVSVYQGGDASKASSYRCINAREV